jgi:acetyltransferase-like isoleucine patch superfamily enzyme
MRKLFQYLRQWVHEVTAPAPNVQQPAATYTQCRVGKDSVIYSTGSIRNKLGCPDDITIGMRTHVRGELLTFGHGGAIHIGDFCYVGEGTRIWSAESIRIGNNVLISHNVNIFDNDTHPIDDALARHRQFVAIITKGHPREINLNEAPVIIEDDALIGCNCIILAGVTIGRASVVGAGSVVTRNVPPYTIVAGNPAKVIRAINQPSRIESSNTP